MALWHGGEIQLCFCFSILNSWHAIMGIWNCRFNSNQFCLRLWPFLRRVDFLGISKGMFNLEPGWIIPKHVVLANFVDQSLILLHLQIKRFLGVFFLTTSWMKRKIASGCNNPAYTHIPCEMRMGFLQRIVVYFLATFPRLFLLFHSK